MKLKYDFVVREVAGTKVAVAVGADHEKFNGMVKLNATGEFIFSRLTANVTADEIVAAMTDKYDVTEDVARAAVADFVAYLRGNDLIDG